MTLLICRIAFHLWSTRVFSLRGFAHGGELCARFMMVVLGFSLTTAAAAPSAHWVVSWGASAGCSMRESLATGFFMMRRRRLWNSA